jgi:hypothetical protein
MKYGKLLFIVFFLCTSSAFAQKFRFGLKATPTVAWFKTDTKGIDSDGSKLTFSWGFMGEYFFADNYAISSGVELVSRGGKISSADTLQVFKSDMRLKYIDIPITIKMRTNEIGYMRYFGQFGFTPGFNIAAKQDVELRDLTNNTTLSINDDDIKSDIVPVNISLAITLGAEYSLSGNTALILSVTFNNGFVDIADDKDLKIMANYVGLNFGVLF